MPKALSAFDCAAMQEENARLIHQHKNDEVASKMLLHVINTMKGSSIHLRTLTNDELLRMADTRPATDLVAELSRRLHGAMDELDAVQSTMSAVDSHGIYDLETYLNRAAALFVAIDDNDWTDRGVIDLVNEQAP